jgi:hypothetical protein
MSNPFEQQPFGGADPDFADNPEPRCPCLLLLDVSGSMRGSPINQLNEGLAQFRDELFADSLARIMQRFDGYGALGAALV